jgi:hypothetical protein
MTYLSYEELVRKVTAKYNTIKHVASPSFPNDQIYFNEKGYRHFFYTGAGKPRPAKQTQCRLRMFDNALSVILAPKKHFNLTCIPSKNGKLIYHWWVEEVVNGKKIRVIVRSKGKNGQKHFYDVIPRWR